MGYKLNTPINRVTIGADPEVFFKNDRGLVVPACGMIGGTKTAPIPVPYGALQEDNIMGEFNIDPCTDVDSFIRNINHVYEDMVDKALAQGLTVATRASARVPMFLLEQYPQAMEFGCEPDYNAYTGRENPTPDTDSTLRTCAGHVHLGFEYDTDSKKELYSGVVGYLDWIVGCWTVLYDDDTARRERYGKAGAFRPKPYGLEYRVPSNFWLKSDDLKRAMFNRIRLAYGMAMSGAPKPSDDDVITSINSHDTAACAELLKECG